MDFFKTPQCWGNRSRGLHPERLSGDPIDSELAFYGLQSVQQMCSERKRKKLFFLGGGVGRFW